MKTEAAAQLESALPEATKDPVTSFISFDVEALPGRATSELLERLVWGRMNGGEYGIRRLSKILSVHRLKGNFLIDFGMCSMYGDKPVKAIVQFLLEEGHEVHAHLHPEWVIRNWGVRGTWPGPLGLDHSDPELTDALMSYTAYKYAELTGLEPSMFRAGAYLFSESAVIAAHKAGFRMLSNYNSSRHAQWRLPDCAQHNDPFRWDNGLLELPVDFSPEPLSFDWPKYVGWYERARTRKAEKTFNLVMHSWSLLKRNGEVFDAYAPDHEERLHQICDHLVSSTTPLGYDAYFRQRMLQPGTPPIVPSLSCELPPHQRTTPLTCCNICGHGFSKTPETDTCPGCNSRARHRQLRDALQRRGNPFDGKIVLANYASTLEQRVFLKKVKNLLNFDIRPVSEVELQMDVQNLSAVRSGAVDAFMALHVLNHVQDDEAALREIQRVLKPGGFACLTVPYREKESTTAHDNPTEHYGPKALEQYGVGSFRRYGLADVLALFGRYFDVETQPGVDPLTEESMLIFWLRKRSAL